MTPWRHPLFRGFAGYTAASWVAYMLMSPFVWRFCFDAPSAHGLGFSVLRTHALLFLLPLAAMAWVAPSWGEAIDRFGPRPVLKVSATAAVLVPALWALAHAERSWLVWVAAAIIGLTWPGIEQVNFYMTVKGFPDERHSAYTAAFQVVFGLATMTGITLGGVCASYWQAHIGSIAWLPAWVSHYQPVFVTSLILRAASLAYLLWRLDLPGKGRSAEVARAVATSVLLTLPGASVLPRPQRRPVAKG